MSSVVWNFNSIKVRFKQKGMTQKDLADLYFNSIKVRFKLSICVSLEMASPPFQFHKGAI